MYQDDLKDRINIAVTNMESIMWEGRQRELDTKTIKLYEANYEEAMELSKYCIFHASRRISDRQYIL